MKNNVIIYFFMFLFLTFLPQKVSASEQTNLYDGQLGYIYSSSSTEFKVWSSSASEIIVVVDGYGEFSLTKDPMTNVWLGFVQGDINGFEYSYNISYEDGTRYEGILDPYGKYLNKDKTRNVVYSDKVISFENWNEIQSNLEISNKNKIIYGINIDTFTNSASWNGSEVNRGKLLSLSEGGTKYNTISTGYDHIKNLGITYIEIPSLMDSVGSFAVNSKYVTGEFSYSGSLELRQVVSSYFLNNIGVILNFDLVNISEEALVNFYKFDKVYFNSQATIDLEKKMFQKYVKDIVIYWVNNYKLSGVKFDNMSSLDVALVNDIKNALLEINNDILIYGDGSYTEQKDNMAGENNLANLSNVAMLNGSLNYALLGDIYDKDTKGILSGTYGDETIESLKFAFLSSVNNGQIDYSKVNGISYKDYWGNKTSFQLVNYLGARNGLSIYDKLRINNISGDKLIEQKIVLAFGTLMISGGIPYIEAGSEFLASYQTSINDDSSICFSNEPNSICFYSIGSKKVLDWSLAYDNKNIIDSFKSMTNFRKSYNNYIQTNASVLKNNVKIYQAEEGILGYSMTYTKSYVGKPQKHVILFNYSNNEYQIDDFGGKGWSNSYQYNLSKRDGNVITMKSNSIYFDTKVMQPKINQWVALLGVLGIIGLIYTLNIFLTKKLVETKGYDVNDINKKYRPFIKKSIKKDDDKNIENKQDEE